MKKVKTKYHGLVHQIAHCQVCGWGNEDYNTARKEARKHTLKTGHRVAVESGIHYTYYLVEN